MQKKIIGIDASRSNTAQKTGTEYYSYEIINRIIKIGDNFFRLYSREPLTYLKEANNVENKVMKFPRLWSQIRLSYEIFVNPPDVLFEPAHTIPLYHGKKTVVTAHDIGFKHFPELYTPLERIYHDFCMGFSLKRATKIITISNATRDDLIKVYKADPKKITVIYHGYDEKKYYPLSAGEQAPESIKKLMPYIFFIGRLEAKKNIKNLVKAFRLYKEKTGNDEKLVLAGRGGYQYEEIKAEIEACPDAIKRDIIELGYVADDMVSDLTRFAKLFAFPSNFEGFGMPLLECMAAGVPIVASDTTSIPEIVEDAGLLCDPKDYIQLSKNIEKICESESLRNDLIKKGLERSKKFSWEKCAKETLDVIESVI
jgi:glycosyltransferase involved in cell wall biosynthesis